MIAKRKTERISHIVISVLYSRFENFPEDAAGNRNAPFHMAFLNAFTDKFQGKVPDIPYFITMSSWLHGLSTTLGQTFFEKTAHILSDGDKREYTSKKLGLLKITESQAAEVTNIISELYNNVHEPNIEREEQKLYALSSGKEVEATGFSADVYYETTDEIIAIELKSVKPNSGEMRGEKKKILEGKAALKRLNPGKNIKFYVGFPFDPTGSGVEYDKVRFANTVINLRKSFALDEILIAGELWDKLSGVIGTMQTLLDVINKIASPDFIEKFNYINNINNRRTPRYVDILEEWNLFEEISIVSNIDTLIEKSKTNSSLQKLINNNLFDNSGKYKIDRAIDLISHIR
ncbi:MAG: TdeIII family type II restriction endonuclease [Tannerellaceae bacterium]